MIEIYRYLKLKRIIEKVYDEEHFEENLSKMYGTQFHRDNIGRLYAVINPYVENGVYKRNEDILEFTQNGMTNRMYVEKWFNERLALAQDFILNKEVFDLVGLRITPVHMKDNKSVEVNDEDYLPIKPVDDNYLLIIEPVTYEKFIKHLKICGFGLLISIFIILGLIICL